MSRSHGSLKPPPGAGWAACSLAVDAAVAVIVCFAALAWGSNEPWAMGVICAGAATVLLFRLAGDAWGDGLRLHQRRLFVPLLLFLAYVAAQSLVARTDLGALPLYPHTIEPHTTGLYLLLALSYFALIYLAAHGFESRARIRFLILSLLALGVFEALYGLVQVLGHVSFIWDYPVTSDVARGTFINRNHYAFFLNLVLCLGLGYLHFRSAHILGGRRLGLRKALAAPGAAPLVWIVVWLALIGLALVMSMSRMGILGMLVGVGLILAVGGASGRGRGATLLALLLLFAILGLSFYTGVESILARYEPISQAGYFEKDRIPLWREAWKMIRLQPWFGRGLGTFQWSFPAYERLQPDVPARYAHNDYLQGIAEVGVAGMILLLAALVACWRIAAHNATRSRDPLARGLGLATLGMLAASMVQEVTDFALYIPGVAVFFCVLIGLNARASRLEARGAAALRTDMITGSVQTR